MFGFLPASARAGFCGCRNEVHFRISRSLIRDKMGQTILELTFFPSGRNGAGFALVLSMAAKNIELFLLQLDGFKTFKTL